MNKFKRLVTYYGSSRMVGQFYLAKLTDDGIVLEDLMFTDRDVHLGVEELADLKRIIDERVG